VYSKRERRLVCNSGSEASLKKPLFKLEDSIRKKLPLRKKKQRERKREAERKNGDRIIKSEIDGSTPLYIDTTCDTLEA